MYRNIEIYMDIYYHSNKNINVPASLQKLTSFVRRLNQSCKIIILTHAANLISSDSKLYLLKRFDKTPSLVIMHIKNLQSVYCTVTISYRKCPLLWFIIMDCRYIPHKLQTSLIKISETNYSATHTFPPRM